MPNDESQIEYRRDPKPGTVVRVPLPEGTFAYGCQTTKVVLWLYSFVTDAPSCDRTLFSPSNWRWPVASFSLLPDVADVCKIELSEAQLKRPATWDPRDRIPGRLGGYVYKLDDPTRSWNEQRYIPEEETKKYYKHVRLEGENLTPYIMTLRDQMELVHVPPESVDHRKPKLRREKPDPNEPVLIEIVLPDPGFYERSDLEEILNETLLDADAGLVSGGGSGPQDSDLVVEAEPKNVKRAIGIIRRVLRKEKCPKNTQIRELLDPPIEHALYAASHRQE